MEKQVTICFQVPESLNALLMAKAQEDDLEADVLLNQMLRRHLKVLGGKNRREHGRLNVDLSAVARPIGEEVGTTILPGKVLDLSAGGLKLRCEFTESNIEELVGIGGQVEIIFTVPEREYPVCFTCEIKHIYQAQNSELGCEFIKSTGDSLDVLKDILNSSE